MNRRLLRLYHGLPGPARSAVATLRGLYLRYWRTGPDTDELAAHALAREGWSAAQWTAWRAERLARLLHRAATRVPYYRAHWEARRARGDRSSWERLEHWPVLEKETVRRTPHAFLADDCVPRRMFHEQTSGTTGTALDIWRSRPTVQALYAIARVRTLRWHGIPAGARWARVGGQLVAPVASRRPPFWVWNAAMRQLYLSAYHLAPDLIPYYLDALVRHRVVYLAGYSSSLYALAWQALRLGRRDLAMTAVFTNAEPVSPEQRAAIEAAFQCPLRETYGMAETVAAGSECPAGRLHQWPEIGHLEVWEDGGLLGAGETGEFLCTGLLNDDMPLIRYRVGDRGRLMPEDTPCPCGRSLPLIAAVEGRTTDNLVTPDGRQVFWLNPVFYGLPVRESQIVQERLDRVRVLVAPAPEFDAADEQRIVHRLRERMGEVVVEVERVRSVPRTGNGKVRAVVCRLAGEDRTAARAVAPASGG